MRECLLTPNPYSRPGNKLLNIKGVVVHWTANPGVSAEKNRLFFESRKSGLLGFGSAHYIVDDCEVIRCIPETEWAYHVGATFYTDLALRGLSAYPNNCTIGVEMCPIDWEGNYAKQTWEQSVGLLRDLMAKYALNPKKDLYRHFDITGKDCPHLLVVCPEKFELLKAQVGGI
jgi:N-acetylmuramoyl-L-alanine amidase